MTWPWAGHRGLEDLLPQLLGLGLARQVKQRMVEIWEPKRLEIGGLLSVVQSICCSILLFNPKPTLNHGECPSHTSSVSCGWFLEIRLAHPALAQSQPPRPRRLSATTAWTWTGEAGETGVGWNLRALMRLPMVEKWTASLRPSLTNSVFSACHYDCRRH